MSALTDAVRAGERLVEVEAAELAEPALRDTCVGRFRRDEVASLASDVPPGLMARNRISSCLNVVGFSTTRTPLDKRHSVMPSALVRRGRGDGPGDGSGSSSGCVLTVSTYAVSGPPLAAVMTAASFASVGQRRLVLLGRGDRDDAVAVGHPVLRPGR